MIPTNNREVPRAQRGRPAEFDGFDKGPRVDSFAREALMFGLKVAGALLAFWIFVSLILCLGR